MRLLDVGGQHPKGTVVMGDPAKCWATPVDRRSSAYPEACNQWVHVKYVSIGLCLEHGREIVG